MLKRTSTTGAFLKSKVPDSNYPNNPESLSEERDSKNSSLEERSNSQARNLQIVSSVENQVTLQRIAQKQIRNLSRLCNRLPVLQDTMTLMT